MKVIRVSSVSDAQYIQTDKGTRVCHAGDDIDCTSELASGKTTTDTDAGFADFFVQDTGTRVCHSGDDKDCTSELASGGTTTDTDADRFTTIQRTVANNVGNNVGEFFVQDTGTRVCHSGDDKDCTSELASGGTTTDTDADATFSVRNNSSGNYVPVVVSPTTVRTVRTANGNNVGEFFVQDTGTRICHSGDDKDCTSELASGGTTTDTDADRFTTVQRTVANSVGNNVVGFQIRG